jgi:hypothetical protein
MTYWNRRTPGSLETDSETSRAGGKKPDKLGLIADEHIAPIPTDSKMKDEAARKVLQDGVTGEDKGAEQAIKRLPDRVVESRA